MLKVSDITVYWKFSYFFIMITLKLWLLERNIIEVNCHFHHIISRVHSTNMTYD